METATLADRDAILSHVRSIFDAFLKKDRETIRATHTDDWTGFPIGGAALVRGIDGYMRAADEVLAKLKAVRYEFLDTEVQVYGDVALLWYVARDFLADGSTVILRSVDVYRREAAGWNQCASHITALPEPPAPSLR